MTDLDVAVAQALDRLLTEREQKAREVNEAERRHPTSGCWFCGLSYATEADNEGRCWFPPSPNQPETACLACALDTHEYGFIDSAQRTDQEHRDVVVSRLVGRTGWEPGLSAEVGWLWFHELPDTEPHPTERFAWVDLDQLSQAADPPQHVCDESCMDLHADFRMRRTGGPEPSPLERELRGSVAEQPPVELVTTVEEERYHAYQSFLARNP